MGHFGHTSITIISRSLESSHIVEGVGLFVVWLYRRLWQLTMTSTDKVDSATDRKDQRVEGKTKVTDGESKANQKPKGSATVSSSPTASAPNSKGGANTTNNKSSPSQTTSSASTSVSKKGNAVTTKKSVNGENTGRWTKEEHATFIEGLNKHGKEWKKIANMIETRTVVQIRTHAQKYFQKIAKTKYEMKGKQPPTDLVSTASNPNRNSGSGDKKRGYRSSKSKSMKALYSLTSVSDPKENSPSNGSNMKHKKGESKGGNANKRNAPLKPVTNARKKKKLQGTNPFTKQSKSKSKTKLKLKSKSKSGLKLNLSEIINESRNNDDSASTEDGSETQSESSPASKQKQKNLKISTNLAKLRKQNDEEDLQWMKSSLNVYTRMADASPTSVAEFGIYRTFGGCDSEYASFGGGNDSEELLTFDSESISDWISNKSDDSSESMDSPIDPSLSPEPAPCEPSTLESEVSVSGFGLNVDETIANWINSPLGDEEDCTLESFSGLNNRPRFNSGDFVELM